MQSNQETEAAVQDELAAARALQHEATEELLAAQARSSELQQQLQTQAHELQALQDR